MVKILGVQAPSDFPKSAYLQLHNDMQAHVADPAFLEYGGGWNGAFYRFVTMTEHDKGFRAALGSGNRSAQERHLYGFFVTGLSVLETFSYALYFIGAIKDKAAFPWTTEGQLRSISPESVSGKFDDAFPGD